jgi:hypothetical protein
MALRAPSDRGTYGFRRVDRVRVHVHGDGRTSADVTGVVHRYERTVAVPLRVAAELVLAGAPFDIDRVEG